jgi:hypothetical protein
MTRALQRLLQEGGTVNMDALSTLSPYRTEHINRLGNYVIDFNRVPEPWNSTRVFLYRQSRRDSAICVFLPESLPPSNSGKFAS